MHLAYRYFLVFNQTSNNFFETPCRKYYLMIKKTFDKILPFQMLFKGKGKKVLLNNWRGIFLTVALSKLFERMIFERQKVDLDSNFSEYAAGARKDRSTLDHLFVVQAVCITST